MGQQHVDAAVLRLRQLHPEPAYAGPRVEHERTPVVERHLHTGRVAPVARGLGARRRDRPAGAPHRQLHASLSVGQKKTIAPTKPSLPITGIPATSTMCSAPPADRIRYVACAARLRRSAMVTGCLSTGIASPRSST